MADKYAVTGSQSANTSTPGKTTLNLFNPGTTKRGQIYDVMISASGTPADNALMWTLQRTTAVGTEGAGVVPTPIDGGAASILDGAETHSAEPTFTAATELWQQMLHQRATWRWVAAPEGKLLIPAATSNGIAARAFHASYTGASEATFHFEE